MLYYIYNNDELVGFKYNGNTYHYHKNLFGDVIGIYDSNNNEVVTYEYDSWGTIVNTIDNSNINLSTLNPFRYRSYYYDEETKLYYLNSRYYNPEFGRFINADAYVSTGQTDLGFNMFDYCGNNPVTRLDVSGNLWKKIKSVLSKVGENIKRLAQKTFGAESTSTNKVLKKDDMSWCGPFSYSTELYTTIISHKSGDSSKPVSFYANIDLDNSIKSSSIGINLNVFRLRLNINLSLDNVGTKISYLDDNYTSAFGTRVNISELKVGYEHSNTVQIDSKTTETSYVNASVDGWFVTAVYVFVTTGVPIPEIGGTMVSAFA